ncbi:hypothetical protein [Flavobacterium sp. MDT1-60]|uniref:hypothetical protein n=1 Tax=Flavobacterium sp. MDT1-60 TaxID=1979344 RepID=UPI001780E032|nr:hypothetical protein [Flavobacterium sp. MDT1-60]QOG02294.1 hypothetical protein IHE43_21335 [Flavobacterium sp. MDT1-60]
MTFNFSEITSILSRSFKLSLKWTVWKFFLSSVGSVGGTLLIGEKFLGLKFQTSLIFGVVLLLFIFLVRWGLIFVKESLKYFHEVYTNSIYGNAIILLNECSASLNEYRKKNTHDDTEFLKAMILLCNNLKIIFTDIVKDECAVSIKVPIASEWNNETLVMNLVRDSEHSSRDTIAYTETKHTLLGNTAFTFCLNKVSSNNTSKAYVNNSVNNSRNYDNTSMALHTDQILPYNSELVFPIVPTNLDHQKHNCVGFICIDSIKENAFDTKYEIEIVKGVADAIYDIIKARNQFKLSEHGEKQQA